MASLNQWAARRTTGPHDKWVDFYGTVLSRACLAADNQIFVRAVDLFTVGDTLTIGSQYEGQVTVTIQSISELVITLTGNVGQAYAENAPVILPLGGGVTDADYLVGTAHADLTNEIVVGTTPGGELGGTWASPTVDASHSGSTHAATQAAAEATAAAALATHEADTTSVHGISDTSTLYRSGGTDVAVADGGTGASTAATARANLGAAPAAGTYLVTTADSELSNEVAVGTTPGGELGGTWASPTVDATHSGSAHHTRSHDHSNASDSTTLNPVTLTVSGVAKFQSAFIYNNTINPSISADQNNWAPTGLATCTLIAVACNGAARTITGFDATGFVEGQTFYISPTSLGGGNFTLSHGSASSTAGNRINCPGNVNYAWTGNGGAQIIYLPSLNANNPFYVIDKP